MGITWLWIIHSITCNNMRGKGILCYLGQQHLSAFEIIGERIFPFFIICKCRSNRIWVEHDRPWSFIGHSESSWELSEIKTPARKISLERSEKLNIFQMWKQSVPRWDGFFLLTQIKCNICPYVGLNSLLWPYTATTQTCALYPWLIHLTWCTRATNPLLIYAPLQTIEDPNCIPYKTGTTNPFLSASSTVLSHSKRNDLQELATVRNWIEQVAWKHLCFLKQWGKRVGNWSFRKDLADVPLMIFS